MEYYKKYVGFDKSNICIIVIKTRIVDCLWIIIKETESGE